MTGMTTSATPPLLAYLHLRPGTPAATPALLRDYIAGFARREGYRLDDVLVGVEGTTEARAVAALLDRVRATGTSTVLIVGPSRTALAAVHRLTGVRVLTLVDVSGSERGTAGVTTP